MSHQNDFGEPANDGGNGAKKLLIVMVMLAIGIGVWLSLRSGGTAATSSASLPTTRPIPLGPVIALRMKSATTKWSANSKDVEELRDGGQERTQTAPDTFSVVQRLVGVDSHVERIPLYDVKVAAVSPDAWPPVNETPREVDLLQGLDLKGAVVHGQWVRGNDGAVRSDLEQLTRLDLGYRPPAEYDLQFTFTREKGNDGLDTVLYAGGRQFYWTFAGWDNTTSGFGTVMGQTAETNTTTTKRDAWLKNGETNKAVVKVRRERVQVYLNDKLVGDHTTDYRDLNLVLRYLSHPDTIGFSTWESDYAIKSVILTEIAGQGQAIKPSRPSTVPTVETAVAAVDFSVAGREPDLYFLMGNGTARSLTSPGNWAINGNQIVFRWGEFIDTCVLSPDRKSFAGHNQIGDSIRGSVRAGRL